MADEVLIDAFIRIGPDPEFASQIDAATDGAIRRIQEKFGKMKVPIAQPFISDRTRGGGGGGRGSRGSSLTDEEKEAARELAEQFKNATRFAGTLQRTVQDLRAEILATGDVRLAEDFAAAQSFLRQVVATLREAKQDSDPLGLERALDRLQRIDATVSSLRGRATGAADVRARFNEIVEAERINRQEFRIQDALTRSTTRGGISGQLQKQIAETRAEIQLAELTFDNLVRSFKGGEEELQRLIRLADQLKGSLAGSSGPSGRSGLSALNQDARQSIQSMNTLQNNAYQLGQAFEDAIVGGMLNGIPGAIRGATNNITFVLQNYAQAQKVAAEAAGRPLSSLANQLPIYAAIGGAVALLVTGPMADWLESLNDIDVEAGNISDKLKKALEETSRAASIRFSESDLRDRLASAGSLDDIVTVLRDLTKEAENGKQSLAGIADGVAQASGGIATTLAASRDAMRRVIEDMDDSIRRIEFNRKHGGISGPLIESLFFDEDETRRIRNNAIGGVADIDRAFQDFFDTIAKARSGNVPLEELKQLLIRLESTKKSIVDSESFFDVSSDSFSKTAIQDLEAAIGAVNSALQESEKIRSVVTQKFGDALEASVRKADELSDRLKIIRSTVEGAAREQALFLKDLQQAAALVEADINRSTVLSQEEKRAALAVQRRSSALAIANQENDLREQLLKLESEIADERERGQKAQFLTAESFASQLQIDILSGRDSDLDRQLEKRRELIALIANAERQRQSVLGGRGIIDDVRGDRFAVDVRPDKFQRPEDMFIKETLAAGFQRMLEEQKRTTEAVNQLEAGARAQ
jgi:hypothetical protein